MKRVTIHKKDIMLNREKLNEIVRDKGVDYTHLYDKIIDEYGLDISYKGFMSLLGNRSSWKLIYAYAIAETLNLSIHDIFEVVEVDVERRIKEKEEWKRKYQKK